jgi:hypothetical protein
MYVIALIATTTLFGPGTLRGSLLELGGIASNRVEFGTTPNGETISVIVLLSNTNVTVCGSATVVGLSHIRLCPTLTCIFCGTNTDNISVELPPPACTLTAVDATALATLTSPPIIVIGDVTATTVNIIAIKKAAAEVLNAIVFSLFFKERLVTYDR